MSVICSLALELFSVLFSERLIYSFLIARNRFSILFNFCFDTLCFCALQVCLFVERDFNEPHDETTSKQSLSNCQIIALSKCGNSGHSCTLTRKGTQTEDLGRRYETSSDVCAEGKQ